MRRDWLQASTIGLQTKRLSGAQRKRLTRERKMREGTWTEKKPPRKTPLFQEKGAVESSGGVKDPTLTRAQRLRKHRKKNTATKKKYSSADWVLQGSCCWYQDGGYS
jgi:hypothetical protein